MLIQLIFILLVNTSIAFSIARLQPQRFFSFPLPFILHPIFPVSLLACFVSLPPSHYYNLSEPVLIPSLFLYLALFPFRV